MQVMILRKRYLINPCLPGERETAPSLGVRLVNAGRKREEKPEKSNRMTGLAGKATCELCGAKDNIEVHHIRKLADLEQKSQANRPEWMKIMAARKRKTLIVYQKCHHDIQYGRYDGLAILGHGRAV
jgi:hypothetical protein